MALRDVFIIREDETYWMDVLGGSDAFWSEISDQVFGHAGTTWPEYEQTAGAYAAALGAPTMGDWPEIRSWFRDPENETKLRSFILKDRRKMAHSGVVSVLDQIVAMLNNGDRAGALALMDSKIKNTKLNGPPERAGTSLILRLSSGWTWVRLSECNHGDERDHMGHCGLINSGGFMCSLRDKKGFPHVTAEVDGKNLVQLRGKENKQPHDKYLPMCRELVRKLGLTTFTETYDNDEYDPNYGGADAFQTNYAGSDTDRVAAALGLAVPDANRERPPAAEVGGDEPGIFIGGILGGNN